MDCSDKEPKPVDRNERIGELDLIRGVALLGILIANMPLYSSPYLYMNLLETQWWTGLGDQIAKNAINVLVEYKFITMFSLLFGAGFMIFLERAEKAGRKGAGRYARRLAVLLAFGLVHGYFVWFGDILVIYAILGIALLAFRTCKANTLLVWAIGLLLVPSAWMALHTFVPGLVPWGLPPGPSTEEAERLVLDSIQAYGSGSYSDIFQQRLADSSNVQNGALLTAPMTFAMFLLGAYAWRKDWLRNPRNHIDFFRKTLAWSGSIGVLFLVYQLWLYYGVDAERSGFNHAQWSGILIAGPAICLFYISSLILLARKPFWRKLLAPFQDAGRMALTNYLMQSVVCTLLFYSYGLGWYGEVSPLYGLLLSLVIFAAQVWGSRLWLRRYRFGPAEWLWRSLTYGERQPMKRG
ncbi:DUF418 domain-containing protein [Paenibacillaceae bacterium WGS1546]|uniref:DUF418 domain-containing protein n=1 Tax=Cohnella sp. WGS1546 TaxID=3366810 RepID=UPI00372D5B9B